MGAFRPYRRNAPRGNAPSPARSRASVAKPGQGRDGETLPPSTSTGVAKALGEPDGCATRQSDTVTPDARAVIGSNRAVIILRPPFERERSTPAADTYRHQVADVYQLAASLMERGSEPQPSARYAPAPLCAITIKQQHGASTASGERNAIASSSPPPSLSEAGAGHVATGTLTVLSRRDARR